MKILVTAGNTQAPIDQVRSITNIFRGRTGVAIADYMADKGAEVTLVSSNKELVLIRKDRPVVYYKTYDQLADIMKDHVMNHDYDVVIHSAAVSDYSVSGVFIKNEKNELVEVDTQAKISSSHAHLYLELSSTEKLIDKIRSHWGFAGKLVKFKLEVGKTREELVNIAERSMHTSTADMIVANCLKWCQHSAIIMSASGEKRDVFRKELPSELWRMINE